MSIKNSSRSSTPSRVSKVALSAELVEDSLRSEILEPNNIALSEYAMDDETWSDLAFSLGLAAKEHRRFNVATQKLAQKMRKRKQHSSAQISDNIKAFIEALVLETPQLSQQSRCSYYPDAVPTADSVRNTIHRLPTPKPTISVGYTRDAFSIAHDELQDGIISSPSGEPCDLKRISQPVANHFWPFLAVEISEQSLFAARAASAITTATCNNAISLLGNAAAVNEESWNNRTYTFDEKFFRSFSLSIHGKIATLSTHSIDQCAAHISVPIASYQLDNESDVAVLADRLHGIIVWARYNRLSEIIAMLDHLDKKVHGNLSGTTIHGDGFDFDPHCLKALKLQPPRKPERMKVVLRASLPSWLVR